MQDNTSEFLPAIQVEPALKAEHPRLTHKCETVCQECEKHANKIALLLELAQQLRDELRVLRRQKPGHKFQNKP